MKILVIEDDLRLSELLRYGLENEGFEVTVCCDGAEGLKCAMQNLSDMILLDRMLPEMSGEEVLKNLRREDVNTPVIFITALGEAAEKKNACALKCQLPGKGIEAGLREADVYTFKKGIGAAFFLFSQSGTGFNARADYRKGLGVVYGD